MKLEKLSANERRFAEENHNLIYSFLHQHEYSIEDFYSIAVFGYLKAVQTYHRTNIRENYSFACIAYSSMKTEIKDHFKAESRQKRKSEENLVSMDAENDGNENLMEMIGDGSAEDAALGKYNMLALLEELSDQQKEIILMRMQGFSNMEIIDRMEIPSSSFYKEINRIRQRVNTKRGEGK